MDRTDTPQESPGHEVVGLEARIAHLEKWTGAMLPIVFGVDARLNMLEGEPPTDMVRPSSIRKLSRRSLSTREDVDIIQVQISTLFDAVARLQEVLKASRITKIRVKT